MRRLFVLAALGFLLVIAGCGRGNLLAVNQPPTVTLTSGPADTSSVPLAWVVDMAWIGSDPDGRIDHYEYAIDPPTVSQARRALAETSWVHTTEQGGRIEFRAATPDERGPGSTATEFHRFALRAVDDRGGVSPMVVRSFYARTIAPDVTILSPAPSALVPAVVGLPMRIHWAGEDPDGNGTHAPASYRVLLLRRTLETLVFLSDPDSLIRLAMATDWQGWRRIRGDTTELVIQPDQLPVQSSALFAVVAVDEAGAATTYADLTRNVLQFENQFAADVAPRIHIYSPFFDFTYDIGGYSLDPLRWIPVELPANTATTFHWDGVASAGRVLSRSRWRVNGNVGEEPGWSTWGPPALSATLPPLDPGRQFLYIEMEDDLGGKSLAIVAADVLALSPSRELLIVDDTRREPDHFVSGNLRPCVTEWPSAAELDTFLYARGGVPWRSSLTDPAAVSPAGLFAGYAFDTLGTRLGLFDAATGVSLSRLALYRHVLWLVDGRGAQYTANLDQTIFPITALYSMSGPGHISTLAAYIAAGGKVWMAGGGAAYASLFNFDKRQNDLGTTTVFDHELGELGVGRVLYDSGHIRSQLSVTSVSAAPVPVAAARGGWSGHGPHRDLQAPAYSRLPALHVRAPDTDALPPTRLSSQSALFYTTRIDHEYLSAPNSIVEDFGQAGGSADLQSALDTLYTSTASGITVTEAPTMVYYHGLENEPFIFTGFSLWQWSRSECQSLVDFVMQDIWRMPKGLAASAGTGTTAPLLRPVVRVITPATRSSAAAPVRRASPARLDPLQRRP